MIQDSGIEETYALQDVINKIQIIQDMKLLMLQKCTFIDKDVKIYQIVNKKSLLKIIERYKKHYKNIHINEDNIIIEMLCDLSFLRVGLEKEILKFMEPYFYIQN
jgi:hypothetical protein